VVALATSARAERAAADADDVDTPPPDLADVVRPRPFVPAIHHVSLTVMALAHELHIRDRERP